MSQSRPANPDYVSTHERIIQVAERTSGTAAEAIVALSLIGAKIDDLDVSDQEAAYLRFNCSSFLINEGMNTGDAAALRLGRQLATKALKATEPKGTFAQQCSYNIANATLEECDLDLPTDRQSQRSVWEPQLIEQRIQHSGRMRQVRSQFLRVAEADTTDAHTRSAAYCNLANALDTSGRWAEAYDYYIKALEASPTNGNAAGNMTQLLADRLRSGRGPRGHIAAVYDTYARLARDLREGTERFAGRTVADRWANLPLTESLGHLAHGVDTDDEYRLWVAEERLALAPVVEGLGNDGSRWDTAAIEVLYTDPSQSEAPAIYGEMNVLKADFIVSRRLAHEGITEMIASELAQLETDPGYYIDTLDYSLYGTQYSKLLLAQRSTLDVLDKTAVVANDHFASGLSANNVDFRSFWMEKNQKLRESLIHSPGKAIAAWALAELAGDLGSGGMYASAQELRNAGTHRIVHAALLNPTGVTRLSRSSIGADILVASTVAALKVTRAAFLYMLDLVAAWNDPEDHVGHYVTLTSPEYSPTVESDSSPTTNEQAAEEPA